MNVLTCCVSDACPCIDEHLPVYAVLRTSFKDEQSLKSRISRLVISIEAHAVSSPNITSPGGERPISTGGQTRDVIWSGRVDVSEDPFTIVAGSSEVPDRQSVLLIWRTFVFLGTNISTQ